VGSRKGRKWAVKWYKGKGKPLGVLKGDTMTPRGYVGYDKCGMINDLSVKHVTDNRPPV